MVHLFTKPAEEHNVMTEVHDNRAILKELEERCDFLARRCEIVGGIAAVGGVYLNPIFFGVAFPLKSWLDQLQLLGQQVSLMTRLIEAFGDEIEIFPNLQPLELRRIDFFLKISKQRIRHFDASIERRCCCHLQSANRKAAIPKSKKRRVEEF